MQQPLVSILIVTWNRRDELRKSITSALAQTYPNTEIVLVNNASTDGTADMVAREFPQIKLIQSDVNLGCPSGRNLGFRHCAGEYIFLLDDDGWLKEDAVERLVERAESDSSLAVVMAQVHEVEGERLVRKRPEGLNEPVYRSNFIGCCALLRRKALDEVGFFPDDFFRQAEEEDLGIRLIEHGYFCFFEPAATMYHAPSAVGRSKKAFVYYSLRNTNKTGLRLWPFPWCALRPLVNLGHAVKFAVTLCYPALPFVLLRDLCVDLIRLPGQRHPVSVRTLHLFRRLQRQPSTTPPV